MTQWIQQLLRQSLAMAVVTAAFYVVTVPLRRRYAARWFYLAGVILLIGFLIPFRPTFTFATDKVPEFMQSPAIREDLAGATNTSLSPQMQSFLYHARWQIVFGIWLAGVLATFLYHGFKHLRFTHTVKRWRVQAKAPQLRAQFERAKRDLHLEGHDIELAHCACITGPMLLWLGKPTILLPENAQADANLRFILLHELIHYKRKDLLCRLLMLLVTAIHWFNPVVYLLIKQVSLQCEISCDEKVVENRDIESRHQYAMSIINIAQYQSKGYTMLTTNFYGGKETMKKRIGSIYEPSKTKIGGILLACAMILTVLAGTSIAGASEGETIQYTHPDAPVKLHEKVDSYVVSWEPLEGIKEYHIGMYAQYETGEPWVEGESSYWTVASGMIGYNQVTDSDGNSYDVENGIWGSIRLDGEATQADVTNLVNTLLEEKGVTYINPETEVKTEAKVKSLLNVRFMMVAVRESGAPIVMDIEIPVA